jgi:hypothetical protein
MIEYMGWIATAVMLVGCWMVGKKNHYGFLLQLAGNLGWLLVGVYRGTQWDLIFVSALFVVMYIYNFARWTWGYQHDI